MEQNNDIQAALDYITGAGHGDFPPEIEDTIKRVLKSAIIAQHPDVNQELLEALKEAESFIKKMSGGGETDFREKLNKAITKSEKQGA